MITLFSSKTKPLTDGPGRLLADSGDRKSPSNPSNKGDSGPGGGSGGGNDPNSQGKPGNLKPSRSLFTLVVALTCALMIFLILTNISSQATPVQTWAEFKTLYENGDLSDVELREDGIYAMTTKLPGTTDGAQHRISYVFATPDSTTRNNFRDKLIEAKGPSFKEVQAPIVRTFIIQSIVILLILAGLWMLISRGLRNATGGAGGMLGNFGKSRHRTLNKEAVSVTFADVAGIEEAKDEVTEIIEFLKNPKKFSKLGGRIPRGVLLIGEPGCGKTLLAKAIAGEADVPFFSISGSDFVEMFVGVGASRVRDLFKQAKESAPCIIFLDEIDAVGRRRGGGFTTGGHDEREQTLNAILVEMDGFNSTDGVIVIAATNRADVLDPALTRPGRFDRQIVVPRPDIKGRVEILRVHAKKVKMGPDVDLERIARATPGFSGADLAAIINEAAIAATLHNKDFVEQEDLEESRDKVRWGRSRKSRVREKEENKLTAYHEAGHAVLQVLLPDGDPLHKVTIIPRGNAGGATFSLPEKDRYGYALKWLKATMKATCGGRIAEEKGMGDVSSGAVSDIAQVTSIARAMVLEWGMSDRLGFVRYAGTDTRELLIPEKEFSDETARIIDQEIKRIIDEAYSDARALLDANWDKVVAVAEALIKYETLSGDEVRKLMKGEPLGKPTVSDLLAAEARAAAQPAPQIKSAQEPPPEIPPGVLPTPA
jgi:cell division protease FtsH